MGGFKFILALNTVITVRCTEAGIEGLFNLFVPYLFGIKILEFNASSCSICHHELAVVVLVVGPISTAAMMAYCTLHPNGVPPFISRGAAHQAV
jgi:hypothetical protein